MDGITFLSKLEAFVYVEAKRLGITLLYEPDTYELVGKFRYRGKAVRRMTHTPDFADPERRFILEVKGYANDTYPLYQKMLFRHLLDRGLEPEFFLVKTQKQAREVLGLIYKQYYTSNE